MAEKVQLEFDYEPGLTDTYPQFIDMIAACIYGCRGGLTAVANELDISVSHLSRILSRRDPDDKRHFDVNWLPMVIKVTDDRRPISWLIERFMQNPDSTRKQMVDRVASVLPLLEEFVKAELGKTGRRAA